MGIDDIAALRTDEPIPAFAQLPRETRREVKQLAANGQLHPDRAIAISSLVYALTTRRRGHRAGLAANATIAVISAALPIGPLGPVGGTSAVHAVVNRKMIKQLGELADRNGWRTAGHGIGIGNGTKLRVTQLASRDRPVTAVTSEVNSNNQSGRHVKRRRRKARL